MQKNCVRKLLKIVALLLSKFIYLPIINIRNYLYDRQFILKTKKLSVTVISVGNLTMGGTGKTPLVIELAKILQKQGYKVGVITRGYKRRNRDLIIADPMENLPAPEYIGDEPYLIAKNTLQVPIGIYKNRLTCGQKLIEKYPCDILIADDCFQHRKIYRDIDIVLWDTMLNPVKEKIFPLGKLREPIYSIKRADILILINNNFDEIKKIFKRIDDSTEVYWATKNITQFVEVDTGRLIEQSKLLGKSILAFCGLGNPYQFFNMLEKTLKPSKIVKRVFPDHYKYKRRDIDTLNRIYNEHRINYMITTEKDLINIKNYNSLSNLLVAKLQLKIQEEFIKFVLAQLSFINSKV
ncbi:MAG: tetraacyldisaccharide 4'-kinase [Candidatus Marinimicrobia bacterium]|nr:tetraacyldisaccharide 4'-kinase [Candidatus Neomarinimicrobiota bacterium]